MPSPARRPSFLALLLGAICLLASSDATAAELTRAIDVRSLSYDEAVAGVPVRIRGTVTFFEKRGGSVFVEDETAGTFFNTGLPHNLTPGDIVEVTGQSFPGQYLPGIKPASFRVIGHGPLPRAVLVHYDDLIGGRYHYQRVAIEGVVRSVTQNDEGNSVLRIAVGTQIVEARIIEKIEDELALVDSQVRVEGLAAGGINKRRQLVQPYLRLRSREELRILTPATPPDDIPRIMAADLATFKLSGPGVHRVRLHGVTTARPSEQKIFIRSNGTALALQFSRPTMAEVGDQIDVAGFVEMDRFSATLVDASLLQHTPGVPPAPLSIEIPDLRAGTADADLVTVTATLIGFFRTENGVSLSLEQKGRTLQARGPAMARDIPLQSLVRVTGICQVESTVSTVLSSRPETVALQLRSDEDVAVLQSPSWWTTRRLAIALMILVGAVLVVGLWIAALRRQVSRQTKALADRIKSQAVLEERQRIARDFHDSLEQDLTGLSLRLAAATTRALDDKGRQIIETSYGLLSRIQTETRNFVSDLRDTAEADGDLTAALEAIAAQRDGTPGIEVRVDFPGPLPLLPAAKSHHLRMITRESLTNALKHARAGRITISAVADNGVLRLRIADDGCGFEPAEATRPRSGHFGCIGMRERARKLGATIDWESAPGQGTTVEVVMPLPGSTTASPRHSAALVPQSSPMSKPATSPSPAASPSP